MHLICNYLLVTMCRLVHGDALYHMYLPAGTHRTANPYTDEGDQQNAGDIGHID